MTGGTASRDRGARAERELVQIFKDAGWPDAHRTSRGVSQAGAGDIQGIEGVHVECKFVQRLSVPAALDQVQRDARPLDLPLLVHRPSRHEWCCTLPLVQALKLLKAAGY